jgi:hypothetical protein
MTLNPAYDSAESRNSYIHRVKRARTHEYFTADDIALRVPDAPTRVDRRIVGPALNELRAEGLIEPTALVRLEAKRCHNRPQSLWKAKDPGGCGQWLACNPPGPEDPPTTLQLTVPF